MWILQGLLSILGLKFFFWTSQRFVMVKGYWVDDSLRTRNCVLGHTLEEITSPSPSHRPTLSPEGTTNSWVFKAMTFICFSLKAEENSSLFSLFCIILGLLSLTLSFSHVQISKNFTDRLDEGLLVHKTKTDKQIKSLWVSVLPKEDSSARTHRHWE